MKRILMIVMVTTLAAITFSCDDVEQAPQFEKSSAEISAAPSVSSVAVSASDSLSTVISFGWNDPQYAVGLDKSKFSVRVGASGANFANFLSKEFTGVLSGPLTGKELNGMALRLGGTIGQPVVLDAIVIASQSNNNEPKTSNVMQITVTPYGDLGLASSKSAVVLNAGDAGNKSIELSWSTAFVGFKGVRTYQLQYAKGGTSFATPTTVDVTTFAKSFTHFELNKIALALGNAAGVAGPVDFRMKATNELGTVLYSNVATVSVTPYIAFNSIGIIGDATAGGWPGADTDMRRPDASKPTEWTLTTYLIGGANVKFRADDGWTDNWGSTSFPAGTGTQNGANIPVNNSGYYKIDFNVSTGAYTFTPVPSPVYTTIGVVGDGVGSWDNDVNLTKDPNDPHVWTGVIALTAAAVKFRAEDGWTNNWGAATLPSGYGTNNGPNISITEAGNYFIWFNDVTGEYFFGKANRNVPYGDVGIVGPAQGSWDTDTNLIKNPTNPFKWSGNITLVADVAKFRTDNGWTVNWGASGFPGGVGSQDGANIPVNAAGTYTVTFNSATGEYTFTK